MGRAAALEEKEQSLLDESMELEVKRSAKEIYMESVAAEREIERRHAVEARKLNYIARVQKVKRLQRQQEFQSLLKKEDFEVKELKTNALLGAYSVDLSPKHDTRISHCWRYDLISQRQRRSWSKSSGLVLCSFLSSLRRSGRRTPRAQKLCTVQQHWYPTTEFSTRPHQSG